MSFSRKILLAIIVLLIAIGVKIYPFKEQKVNFTSVKNKKKSTPKGQLPSFPKEAYLSMGEGFLGNKNEKLKQILKSHLIYKGRNNRPDHEKSLYFFVNQEQEYSLSEGQKYDAGTLKLESVDEELSKLSFQILNEEGESIMFLYGEGGEKLFELPLEKEDDESTAVIGEYKLDSYLLMRQRANWLGKDLFLKEYGGEEYSHVKNSERLDFLDKDRVYFCFAKAGDQLIFKENKWQPIEGDSSLYPLLQVQKIENQVMHICVWDESGKQQEYYLLSKSQSSCSFNTITPLKFIGARTKRKWLVKSNEERLSIEPGDWLVHKGYKWEKLGKVEDIDEYIEAINLGELFITKEFKEKNGNKCLVGDLFNITRTEKKDYEIIFKKEQE